jgi:hypothetical protein
MLLQYGDTSMRSTEKKLLFLYTFTAGIKPGEKKVAVAIFFQIFSPITCGRRYSPDHPTGLSWAVRPNNRASRWTTFPKVTVCGRIAARKTFYRFVFLRRDFF